MKIKNMLEKYELTSYLYDVFRQMYFKSFSDEKIIKRKFNKRLGRDVNLENPLKYNDKLQWLKLNWYDPLATQCADKYGVRKHVMDTIGEKYLNELIDVYDSVEEIDIDKLPNSFVLKGTHGSGFNIICKDKNKMNWKHEFKKMRSWLRQNYYWANREWVYKDIKPRIVCEEYMEDDKSNYLTDYKFFCFNGLPEFCLKIDKNNSNKETYSFFDKQWNLLDLKVSGISMSNENKKPEQYAKMLELAKKLSSEFPFVRVDFYFVKGKIYFGELTFFPSSGFIPFEPPEWDDKLGKLLQLPGDRKTI